MYKILYTKHRQKQKFMASYSETFTFAELDNLTGVRRASRDLLEKQGVSLTGKAKTELGGAAAEQAVNAQIALSKGIEAMKKGTVMEALSYFVQSQSYDPQLAEAASRVNIVSADISSGNIGADARNDITWRKAWLERLTECEQWVTNYVRKPAAFTGLPPAAAIPVPGRFRRKPGPPIKVAAAQNAGVRAYYPWFLVF
jgi:hypothetical protein